MKKFIVCTICALCCMATAQAQKFALVDMEYILKNVPAYERANEQLAQVSKKWQAEVEALNTEAQTMYKNYQNEVVFLSQEQKKAKQEAIMQKEKEASDLKKKYFGPEGELFKKREGPDDAYPGGNLQRREGHQRLAWLFVGCRPRLQLGNYLWFAQGGHLQ